MRHAIARCLLVFLAGSTACGRTVAFVQFENALMKEFKTNFVSMSLKDSELTIRLPNSPAAGYVETEQRAYALRVAVFARDHLPKDTKIQVLHIGFSDEESSGSGKSSASAPFTFAISALGPPGSEAPSPVPD